MLFQGAMHVPGPGQSRYSASGIGFWTFSRFISAVLTGGEGMGQPRTWCEIDFEAMDKKPVHLFFLIAAPEDAIGAHLNVMARLSFLMKSEENRQKLLNVKSPGELLSILDSVD